MISTMQDALANCYGNPSSSHGFGRTAKTAIEKTRKTIAKYLNAHPAEIIFTSGGTEADNMILRCSVRDLGVKTLITSKIEHHAVLHTAEALAKEYDLDLLFVDLDSYGNPDLAHLEALLKRDGSKKLVSLMHVNNEIGNITDIEAVGKLCQEHDALFHSDTVQSIGHFPWDVQKSNAHFLTAAAHKFHGPKGVGFAYIKRNTGLKPLIFGGSQERGFRAGTEPFHNIVGLEEAFKSAYDHLDEERRYVTELKRYFIEKISKAIPDVAFNGLSGDREGGTYTLVNVRLPFDSDKAVPKAVHASPVAILVRMFSRKYFPLKTWKSLLCAFPSQNIIPKKNWITLLRCYVNMVPISSFFGLLGVPGRKGIFWKQVSSSDR